MIYIFWLGSLTWITNASIPQSRIKETNIKKVDLAMLKIAFHLPIIGLYDKLEIAQIDEKPSVLPMYWLFMMPTAYLCSKVSFC